MDTERFDEMWMPEPNTGCWLWLGSATAAGYGNVRFGGRVVYAHRVAYERWRGPIAEGMVIDHLCRNRRCINPEHMDVVTRGENNLRGVGSPAVNAAKTHCKRGHVLAGSNLYHTRTGARQCRSCQRLYGAQRRAKEVRHA